MSEPLNPAQQRERDVRHSGDAREPINDHSHFIHEEIARRLHIPAPVVTRETRLMGGVVAAIAWLEQDRDMRNGSPSWHALQELRQTLADCRRLP